MKLSKTLLPIGLFTLFMTANYASDTDCVDGNQTEQGNTTIIDDSICVTPPTLPYPDRPDCTEAVRYVQGNDNNCTDGTEAPDPGPYPPVPSTPCPAGKYTDQGTGTCTLNAPSTTEPLPANLTIDNAALQKVIVSTFDDTPYDPAIDIQGVIDADGLTINVPYTVTTASVTLPARRNSVTLNASVTQDGESGIIMTLAWAEQSNLPVGSGTFTATLTIDDSAGNGNDLYNAKKLDIEDDNEGLVAATLAYATNHTGDEGNVTLLIHPGILDRMFRIADNNGDTTTHEFIYFPVTNQITGKTWLANNLGANYANMNSTAFNPSKQATASDDYNAYGSNFQWGRQADGHALMNWTSGTSGSGTNGTTTTLSNEPTDAKFIKVGTSPYDWRIDSNSSLWENEAASNNICPTGYRVPTTEELVEEKNSWITQDITGALHSTLVLTLTGWRIYSSAAYWYGDYSGPWGKYWSQKATVDYYGNQVAYMFDIREGTTFSSEPRATGSAVRCIKE